MRNLKIGMAQVAPIWLNKSKKTEKVVEMVHQAGEEKCDLIVFGEGFLPGYPFWLSFTDASTFESPQQKEWHAHYIREAIQIEEGDLDSICQAAQMNQTAIYLGIIERAKDRGNHSLYCSLVYINKSGSIESIHRKLQPTYEERLAWSPGDGHGLTVHPLEEFTVGGLNCWENWMPLARTALYAQGENLHVAVWPGSSRNTKDITQFISKESRSFVVSVSSILQKKDIPMSIPNATDLIDLAPETMADGGSCIASPSGDWIITPQVGEEGLFTAVIDLNEVLKERQNFDPSGHYSRPDITQLHVDRARQNTVRFKD